MKPFGVLPAMLMIILSVGLVNHVLVVPLLLTAAHRDAWICEIIALVISLPWMLVPLYGLLKRMNGQPFDQWLAQRLPLFVTRIVIGVFLLILLYIAFETLIVTASWTATTYLPNTPSIVVCAVFLGLCLFAASSGLRTLAYVSCILLPLVVLLGDFVMSANLPHKDYHYLLPMFENGTAPLIQGVYYTLTSSCELFVFLFIQHHISGKLKRWHFLVLTLFLMLLTVGPVTGAIVEFGPVEAEKMRYPAFSQWRLVSIGKYFEHVDFFAVFQWMSGAMIRLALAIHILSEFGPLRRLKRKWVSPSVLGVIILVVSYLGINNMIMYRNLITWVFLYTGLFMIIFSSLLWLVSFKRKNRGDQTRSAIIGSEEVEQ